MTSDPGSFAQDTLKIRVPAILEETIALNDFPPKVLARLRELSAELSGGAIRGLQEDTPDADFWAAVSTPYIGRTWLEVPWYWAEAFFYRRVLEATGYFRPGVMESFDPFAVKKRTEWAQNAAPAAVASLWESLPRQPAPRLRRLLHASLWGNRTDLSYEVAKHLGSTREAHHEEENLLVDDSARAAAHIMVHAGRPMALIADNAGTELLMDLALIEHLLSEELASELVLHLKPQPFYVSDTMLRDLEDGLDAMAAAGGAPARLAASLRGHLATGRLRPAAHWAWASSLFFFELPGDLWDTLAGTALVFVKGDANYRRLLGDYHWPPTSTFDRLVAYFPAPVVALRTFKSELISGLQPGEAERLDAIDPRWRVNGRRGVIQARLPGAAANTS